MKAFQRKESQLKLLDILLDVDVILFDFVVQGIAVDSQAPCRYGDVIASLFQRRDDSRSLLIGQGVGAGFRRGRHAGGGLPLEENLFHILRLEKSRPLGRGDGQLGDQIAQLPDVPRPRVDLQPLHTLRLKPALGACLVEEVTYQQGNVPSSLPQGRNRHLQLRSQTNWPNASACGYRGGLLPAFV